MGRFSENALMENDGVMKLSNRMLWENTQITNARFLCSETVFQC